MREINIPGNLNCVYATMLGHVMKIKKNQKQKKMKSC